MDHTVPTRLMTAEDRKFTWTVGGAFAVLGGVALWRGRQVTATVFFALAALLALLGIVAPRAVPPVRAAWMKGAHAMSRVTTPIILGILYFVILTPIGLVRRLAGKNAMRVRRAESYWVARDPAAGTAEEMNRQF